MSHHKMHNRQSIRLQGYDYSSPGFYFITICVQNMEHIFGEVIDEEMVLNEFGNIAYDFLNQIDLRYQNMRIDEFIVMPNPVHGIIELLNPNPFVGAIHESPLRMEINTELYRKKLRFPV